MNSPSHQDQQNNNKQAGAELCQSQVKLGVLVYIGVKVELEIVVEVSIQLLARMMLNLTKVEV